MPKQPSRPRAKAPELRPPEVGDRVASDTTTSTTEPHIKAALSQVVALRDAVELTVSNLRASLAACLNALAALGENNGTTANRDTRRIDFLIAHCSVSFRSTRVKEVDPPDLRAALDNAMRLHEFT